MVPFLALIGEPYGAVYNIEICFITRLLFLRASLCFDILDGGSCFHSEPVGSWAASFGSACSCASLITIGAIVLSRGFWTYENRSRTDDLEGDMVWYHGLEDEKVETQAEV